MGGKKVTIGYQYFMGMHLVVCQGDDAQIKQVTMGGREVWAGSVNTNTTVYFDKPDLFGGKEKEGGVQGDCDFMFGHASQAPNTYLVSKIGGTVPAARRVISLVLNHCYLASINPYLKPMKVKVQRIPQQWYAAKSVIGNGHMNPAHIIYEALTNPDWGMGYSTASIDTTSFTAAADTLYTEGFGLSMVWRRESSIEDFLNSVLDHINGAIYLDRTTGNFRLKLIRDDYVVGDLPVFDESNILRLSEFDRPSLGETVNAVMVKYADEVDDEPRAVTVHNLANVQAQGATVGQTREYMGIPNADLAKRVAMRDLQVLSAPLARISIETNRDAWGLSAGDPFVFAWPDLGIDQLVMRVSSIRMDADSSGKFYIEAVEDVFGLPSASYLGDQGSDWVNPIGDPQPVPSLKVIETPYWHLSTELDPADFAALTTTSSPVSVLAAKAAGTDLHCELHTGPSSGNETNTNGDIIHHAPWGEVANTVSSRTTTTVTLSAEIGINSVLTLPVAAVWGDEIILIEAINGLVLTVKRGIYDSIPVEHAANSEMFVLEDLDASDPQERIDGETIWYRPVNVNGLGPTSWASSPNAGITVDARQNKPYAPGNVRFNGALWPTSVADDVAITWTHRDRDEPGQPLSWDHATDHQEAGVTYTVAIYDASNTLLRTFTGVTGNSVSYTVQDEIDDSGTLSLRMRVDITAHRDGLDSQFVFSHTFDRTFTSTENGWDLTVEHTGQAPDFNLTGLA